MLDPPDPPKSHLIRRADVPAWLAGSAVARVTIHRTSPQAAHLIREHGVDIRRSAVDVAWGRGFYTSTRPQPEWGEAEVRVAVRLLRPLIVIDRIAAQEQIDELLASAGSEDVSATLQAAGYDGVLVHWEWGEMWVVAYREDQIRVVEE